MLIFLSKLSNSVGECEMCVMLLSLFSVADGRHGIVRVDRVPLACKLVDLPCMIESLKTVDKKTFYKTADVCQVKSPAVKKNKITKVLYVKRMC